MTNCNGLQATYKDPWNAVCPRFRKGNLDHVLRVLRVSGTGEIPDLMAKNIITSPSFSLL
jgi:hypothetical protein